MPEQPISETPAPGDIRRRTLIKGAAWSAPAIVAAAVAPISAASMRVKYTLRVTGSGSDAGTCTFTLPAGATDFAYDVRGGAGGGGTPSFGGGGAPAHVTGTFSNPNQATTMTIIGAGGGLWAGWNLGSGFIAPRVGKGGQGFGNGGTSPLPPDHGAYPPAMTQGGGGGGGGSAILIGSAPIVVAGGGGGGGSASTQFIANPPNSSEATYGASGGDAARTQWGTASNGQDHTVTLSYSGTVLNSLTAGGGRGAAPGAPGSGGTWASSGSWNTTPPFGTVGASGTAPTAGSGGDGGDGTTIHIGGITWITDSGSPGGSGRVQFTDMTATSGGGGGGYFGGGAGATVGGQYDGTPTSANVEAGGGTGGGGSNFITNDQFNGMYATDILFLSDGETTAPGQDGAPGSVTVTFMAQAGLTFPCML